MKNNTKLLSLLVVFILVLTSLFVIASCDENNDSQPCTITFVKDGKETTWATITGTTFELPSVKDKTTGKFLGWYTDDGVKWENTTVITTTTLKLTAKWESPSYTVTYNLNGGTLNTTEYPTSYTEDQVGEILPLPTPTREGYVFGGWYESSTFSGSAHTVVPTTNYSNVKLYAKWDIVSYVIRYYTEGGKTSTDKLKDTYDSVSGNKVLPTATREGFQFAGWYDSPAYSGTAMTTFDVSRKENITLYAKWVANDYTITFDSQGGTPVDSYSYKSTDGLLPLPSATKTNFVFAGWYRDAACTGAAIWDWPCTNMENVTLFAKWSASDDGRAGLEEEVPTLIPYHESTPYTDPVKCYAHINTSNRINKDTRYDQSVVVPTTAGTYTHRLHLTKAKNEGIRLYSGTAFTETGYDWTKDYNAITFWAYSPKATNAMVGLIYIIKDSNEKQGITFTYRRLDITLDWVGWRQITMTFDTFQGGGNGGTMADGVAWCWITQNGWGYDGSGSDDSYIYFEDMYLTKTTSAYTVYPENVTQNDLVTVKNRIKNLIIGNETLNATTAVASRISFSDYIAQMKNMDLTSKEILFKDIGTVVSNGENIQASYERVRNWAKAYATPGSTYYKNKTYLEYIKKALDWLYTNAYNENTKSSGNWFQWEIGIPIALAETVLILEDDLNAQFKGRIALYLKGLDHFVPLPSSCMANRTDEAYAALISACLQGDIERVINILQLVITQFDYVTREEGFYLDGSHIMHKHNPYINGYGSAMMTSMSDIIYAIADTPLSFSQDYISQWFEIFFNCYAPFCHAGYGYVCYSGRGRSSNMTNKGASWYGQMFKLVPYATEEDQLKFYTSLATESKISNSRMYAYNQVEWICIADYIAFMQRCDSDTYDTTYHNYAKLTTAQDRVLQITDVYDVTLSMSSTRVFRYESINGANQNGWYLGDGVLYVYTTPGEINTSYFSGLNMYRIPGITCGDQTRQLETQNTSDDEPYGASSFVGAVTNDINNPLYSVCAMEFGADTHAIVSKAAGYNEDLSARKAYFFFDDEIVCVGVGITSSKDSNIYTVVDNRLLYNASFYVNSSLVAEKGGNKTDKAYNDTDTIYLEGFGGYYFFEGSDLTINQNGEHLEILQVHGQNPDGETYAYVMTPNMSKNDFDFYMNDPDVEILKMNESVIVVKEKTLGMTGYIFWEDTVTSGSLDGALKIKATNKCLVYTTEKEDGSYLISCSDPTQLLQKVTIDVYGHFELPADCEDVVATYNSNLDKTTLVFTTKGLQGQSVTTTIIPVED